VNTWRAGTPFRRACSPADEIVTFTPRGGAWQGADVTSKSAPLAAYLAALPA